MFPVLIEENGKLRVAKTANDLPINSDFRIIEHKTSRYDWHMRNVHPGKKVTGEHCSYMYYVVTAPQGKWSLICLDTFSLQCEGLTDSEIIEFLTKHELFPC